LTVEIPEGIEGKMKAALVNLGLPGDEDVMLQFRPMYVALVDGKAFPQQRAESRARQAVG
jgi:hypothetical protein